MKKIGVIIGRFQVPQLHAGHCGIIKYVQSKSYWTCILLGVSPIFSRKNPLNFCQRKHMIKETFQNVDVFPLPNVPKDSDWSERLDNLLESLYPCKDVTLYHGRDSFVDSYTGKFRTELVDIDSQESGSFHRRNCSTPYNEDARRAIINAADLLYPTSYQAVDAVVFECEKKVLLCKKLVYNEWVLPGGFVDPNDSSLEDACVRELEEETGIDASYGCHYLGSYRIPDWRYKGSEHAIMTAAFVINFSKIPISRKQSTEEIKDIGLFDRATSLKMIHSDHKRILEEAWKKISSR